MQAVLRTLIALLASMTTASAQRPCDTLVLSDGKRIPAQIIHSKEGYIHYYKCEDFVKKEQQIARAQVSGFLSFKSETTDKDNSGNEPKPSLFQKRNIQDWDKNTFTATVGLSLTDHLSFTTDIEDESAFQFGFQFKPKKSLFQVGLYARPLRYYNPERFDHFNKTGSNAEFTLTVKKLTYGRFTGIIKYGYWGLEVQSGARSYSYQEEVFSLGLRTIKTKTKTGAFLARFGIQIALDHVYFDFSMSAGPRFYLSETTGGLNPESDSNNYISIQPNLGAGIHF